jgi:hypothetical protein
MLSPHELATLVLVQHAERTADIDQSNLLALVDHGLVEVDLVCTSARPRLTDRGYAFLHRLGVLHEA